jgi:hypothetical protein
MPTFLTLPPEIRNAIYADVFIPPVNNDIPIVPCVESPLSKGLLLDPRQHPPQCSPTSSRTRNDSKSNDSNSEDESKTTLASTTRRPSHLSTLLTCRQIHREVHLLALSTTIFHLHSTAALPETFAAQSQPLTTPQIAALKHLTLTARVTQLRALNETWNGKPFGHPSLNLETLTIVPQRPDAGNSAWAEVAELNQSHTLSHVLAETFKSLRGVREVRVVNGGCFGEGVWPLVYRHVVVKIWTWGGTNCGLRFEEGGEGETAWFRTFIGASEKGVEDGAGGGGGERGEDAAVEAHRLLGIAGTSPGAVAGTPLA